MTDYTDLLARLRASTEGTTQGPWSLAEGSQTAHCCFSASVVVPWPDHGSDMRSILEAFGDADARFAAAARQLVPEAAAAIAALQAQVRELAMDVLATSGQAQEAYQAQLATEAERDALREAVTRIDEWADAYPLDVFPEPDFAKADEVLKGAGLSLGAISASNMRHVVKSVKSITRAALTAPKHPTPDAPPPPK